eukprot:CAMPEP_0202701948 /NCGR_PEP_ID=MMETSP1385-20130828/14992_1 /ASSEMBLY_ACC=CAM_ASM_000861 /TAXON_ID=933848 /ORGANISM="Elphidium margaritaceum" /LENGTH=364 /DNA_ID=CAMNT_0049359479 /DNA_START=80 /DNA_END=1171 /DNA_ORIENTATION=+
MSRYYDYDYDRGCIIGFGSDHDDNSGKMSTSTSYNSLSSSAYDSLTSTSTSNVHIHVPRTAVDVNTSITAALCNTNVSTSAIANTNANTNVDSVLMHDNDDIVCIQQAQPDDFKQYKLKPCIVEVPFLLNADRLKYAEWKQTQATTTAPAQKQQKKAMHIEYGDSVDKAHIHRRLVTDEQQIKLPATNESVSGSGSASATSLSSFKISPEISSEKIARSHDYNGAYFNLFGSARIAPSQCHVWRLQMLGHSPCIVGVIDSDAPLLKNGAYFGGDTHYIAYSFNSVTAETYCSAYKQQQPNYQRMLQSGRLDKPMIVDLKLDMVHGRMSIANQTPNCQHCGKEILLFDGIDVSKTYKLGISLLGP